MLWENNGSMVETLARDQIGMMCVTDSPISKVSGTVEYNFQLGLRRLTIDTGDSSLNSGWMGYNTQLPVSELEARTHTALSQWQERHIRRALQGYRPWSNGRLMRSLLAEVMLAMQGSAPWQRLFR